LVALSSLALLAIACRTDETSSGSSGGTSSSTGGHRGNPSVPELDATGDFVHHTYEPTFGAVYREIFFPTCAAAFCHKSNELFFNAVTADIAYGTTVNVVTNSPECGATGLRRIDPGHPESSLLYLKLTDPPCGRKMPQTFSMQLDPREIEQIRQWIANGAPRDGEAAPDAG
jgi:hypothetical protein